VARGPLRRLTANGRVKIASLVVAILLFAHVYTEREQEQGFVLPVHVTGLATGLSVDTIAPPEVRVRVRGTGKDMLRMRVRPPQLFLDCRGAAVGERKVPVASSRIVFPLRSAAQVSEVIEPTSVMVAIDSLATARVAVRPRVRGRPAPGYAFTVSDVEPDSVEVVGPGRAVTAVHALETLPVDVAGARRGFRRDVRVAAPGMLTARPARVRVTVTVRIGATPGT